MKNKILPLLLASSILASCSSVYRSGQTPDDVYYSPTREITKTEDKEEEQKVEENTTADDQYLKMKVRDRYRWSRIDDYDYWNDTRYDHCNCHCTGGSYGYNPYYNPYYYPIRYNAWNNPYYPVIVYGPTRTIRGNTTAANIKGYNTRVYSNTNSPTNPKTGTANNQGSLIKRVFTSSGTSVDRTQRTFDNGSGSSSTTTTSSSAGGKSGGYGSTGSSSSGGRGGRGN
ncbi:MAG TPA: hypothetical protein VF145_06580 [Chitinophagaceae bacterium]